MDDTELIERLKQDVARAIDSRAMVKEKYDAVIDGVYQILEHYYNENSSDAGLTVDKICDYLVDNHNMDSPKSKVYEVTVTLEYECRFSVKTNADEMEVRYAFDNLDNAQLISAAADLMYEGGYDIVDVVEVDSSMDVNVWED